ncbi:MAG: diguanylate cyclase [Pseudomonadota bacterium]
MQVESKFKFGAIFVVVVMLFVASIPYATNSATRTMLLQLDKSTHEVQAYERLQSLLQNAETGQRGFIITGKQAFLAPYFTALAQFPTLRREITNLSNPDDRDVKEIFRFADLKLDELDETITLRSEKGFTAATQVVLSARGKSYMDECRLLINKKSQIALDQQRHLRELLNERQQYTLFVSLGVTLANILLLSLLLWLMFRLLSDRQSTTDLLQQTSDELTENIAHTQSHNRQMTLTAEMLQSLGTLTSLDGSAKVISTYCAKILPGSAGALFLYRNSRDILEAQACWGALEVAAQPFEPNACWALQRGSPHLVMGSDDLLCKHYPATEKMLRLCTPLVSQGEVIGSLYVEKLETDAQLLEAQRQVISRVSEQIALALVNIQLRDSLRRQSITDPLTGLFNRRYMDETLKRELYRAQRKETSLALIVLDLDHFKLVNDTHGHDAGDVLLKAVAQRVRDNIRESDLACRFGGEELVVLLPECTLATALERAEKIRSSIAELSIPLAGGALLAATASFGVAAFPEHRSEAAALLSAADQALYQAKHSGRNRVLAASGSTLPA